MKKVLFSSSLCNPCKQLKDYIETNGITYDEIHDIDTKEGSAIADKLKIKGVPTSLFLDENNKEISRLTGFSPEAFNKFWERINENKLTTNINRDLGK